MGSHPRACVVSRLPILGNTPVVAIVLVERSGQYAWSRGWTPVSNLLPGTYTLNNRVDLEEPLKTLNHLAPFLLEKDKDSFKSVETITWERFFYLNEERWLKFKGPPKMLERDIFVGLVRQDVLDVLAPLNKELELRAKHLADLVAQYSNPDCSYAIQKEFMNKAYCDYKLYCFKDYLNAEGRFHLFPQALESTSLQEFVNWVRLNDLQQAVHYLTNTNFWPDNDAQEFFPKQLEYHKEMVKILEKECSRS